MTGFRVSLAILVLSFAAMAMVAHSSDYYSVDLGFSGEPDGHGLVVGALEDEMFMESETARRQLAQSRYISYGAMARNNVPCNQRGKSYYDCNNNQQANPYNRGCTKATQCARNNR